MKSTQGLNQLVFDRHLKSLDKAVSIDSFKLISNYAIVITIKSGERMSTSLKYGASKAHHLRWTGFDVTPFLGPGAMRVGGYAAAA